MSDVDLTLMILGNQVQSFRIVWYYIPGYDDAYCVGNDGSLWTRKIHVGFGKWVIGGPDDWRKMNPGSDQDGYLQTRISVNGKITNIRIHQLVAKLFIGPKPSGLQCCYNDGDRKNNHVCNLRYDTSLGNQRDRLKHGTHNRGDRHPKAFLNQIIVDQIRKEYNEMLASQPKIGKGKYIQVHLARKWGVSFARIHSIVHNKSWSYLT